MIIHFQGKELPYMGKLPIDGLVDFMRQFGTVWYGTLTQTQFVAKFKRRMFSMLAELTDIENIMMNQQYKIDQIRFNLELADNAQKINRWYWPAVAYNYIDWPTGNSRMFASGLTHARPWENLEVLAICQDQQPDFLDNPVEIKTDQQFNNLLRFSEWSSTSLIPEIFLEITPSNQFSVSFNEIDPYLKHKTSVANRFDEYLQWSQQNPSGTKIGIYTDWPEQISDSFNYWDYKILGPSHWHNPARPASIENVTHRPTWPENTDYLLYVTNPMHIDLSQFLIWMDNKHYQYADMSWKFAMVTKKSSNRLTKMISIADIDSMQK